MPLGGASGGDPRPPWRNWPDEADADADDGTIRPAPCCMPPGILIWWLDWFAVRWIITTQPRSTAAASSSATSGIGWDRWRNPAARRWRRPSASWRRSISSTWNSPSAPRYAHSIESARDWMDGAFWFIDKFGWFETAIQQLVGRSARGSGGHVHRPHDGGDPGAPGCPRAVQSHPGRGG